MKKLIFILLFVLTGAALAIGQQRVERSQLTQIKKIYYHNGTPFTGIAVEYATPDVNANTFTVVDGVANGVRIWFFDPEMTKVRATVPIVNDLNHGQYTGYYEDGTVSFTLPYVNDRKHGTRYCWREDGSLWHMHEYRKDIETQNSNFYPDTGNISNTTRYRNGKRHGLFISYSNINPGQMNRTCDYRNGKKHGWEKTYSQGELTKKEKYKEGERVKSISIKGR